MSKFAHVSSVWRPFWCSRLCLDATSHLPITVGEVQNIVRKSTRLRAVGAGHTTSDLQCTRGDLVIVQDNFCYFRELDSANVATFGAGCQVKYALDVLSKKGFQLKGTPYVTDHTLGGAIAISSYGKDGTPFADHVQSINAVVANGSLVTLSKNDSEWNAWMGSIGRLGVVVEVKIRVYPIEYIKCKTEVVNPNVFQKMLQNVSYSSFEAQHHRATHTHQVSYATKSCARVSERDITPSGFKTKDTFLLAFVKDNFVTPFIVVFGSGVMHWTWISNLVQNAFEGEPYRVHKVSLAVDEFHGATQYNPLLAKEYSIPISSCHDVITTISQRFPSIYLYVHIRRTKAHSNWLSWAPTDACTLSIETFDYNQADFVESERRFRMTLEDIIISNGGSGHRGKSWYRHASDLFRNNAQGATKFESYRQRLDPTSKFENLYTLEMKSTDQRIHEVIPIELQVRAFTWRLMIWVAVTMTVLAWIVLCCHMRNLCSRRKSASNRIILVSHVKNVKSLSKTPRRYAAPGRARPWPKIDPVANPNGSALPPRSVADKHKTKVSTEIRKTSTSTDDMKANSTQNSHKHASRHAFANRHGNAQSKTSSRASSVPIPSRRPQFTEPDKRSQSIVRQREQERSRQRR